MNKKPLRSSKSHSNTHQAYLTGRRRKFLIDRLKEIDDMSDREYAALKADAARLKAFFEGRTLPPRKSSKRRNSNGAASSQS